MSIAQFYASTDSGAPQLSGQLGTLKTLIRALTIGASGVAYGAGPSAKPALGWTLVDETSSKLIIHGALGGTGIPVRIDDSGSGAGSHREAFVFGVESATAVDTYVDRFPTSVQLSAGLVWRKSNTLDATATPWWAWGDDKTFYLMVNYYGGVFAALYGFGDFKSLKPGDAFNFFVTGGTAVNNATTIPFTFGSAAAYAVSTCSYVARSYNQTIKSVGIGHLWPFMPTAGENSAGTFQSPVASAYPSPVNSGLVCAPINIYQANLARGTLRGVYSPMHTTGITPWTHITGVNGFPGATLTFTNTFSNSGTGLVLAEHGAEFV